MQSSRNSRHVASVALPRAVGRQPLRVGRAAVPDVPAVPHVRALHALRVHPGARVLRAPGGVPRALPPGGEGARLGRGQPPVGLQRGPHAHRHGARHHRARRHQEGHVLRLTARRAFEVMLVERAKFLGLLYTLKYYLRTKISYVNASDCRCHSLLRFVQQFPEAGNDPVRSSCFEIGLRLFSGLFLYIPNANRFYQVLTAPLAFHIV